MKKLDWLIGVFIFLLFILALLGTMPMLNVRADELVDDVQYRYFGVELSTGNSYVSQELLYCNLEEIEIDLSSGRTVLMGTVAPLQPLFVIYDMGLERIMKIYGATNGLFMVVYETFDDRVPPVEAFWLNFGECPAEEWNDADD